VKVESEPRPDSRPGETAAASASRSSRGRPRQAATENAILRATIELLTEFGVSGTTTNAIVARSGSSKATLYRRWPSRDMLILEALRTAVRGQPNDIRTAVELEHRLRSTVQGAARRGAKIFDSRIFRAVFPTIARELLSGSTIGQQFRADVFSPIRIAAKARLREAVERGEVEGTVDGDLVFDLIYGGLLYRTLIGEPVNDAVADGLADILMAGVAGPRYRTRPGSRVRPRGLSPRTRSRS
jgi:AcrR family transcriptional regulator